MLPNVQGEIEAMQMVANALEPLDKEARERVLAWAGKRYDVRPEEPDGRRDETRPEDRAAPPKFDEFVDLFDVANPSGEQDRALVAGYWEQEVRRQGSFTGAQVNSLLKDMGRGVANITKALTRLQAAKPALVRQVSKSGRTQQARKTYKLTVAGIRHVEAMLGDNETE